MFKTTRNWKVLAARMDHYTNLEMIEYLMREGYQLVQGFEHHLISRAVFIINDKVVVKIAKNNCGVEQNWTEQQVYAQLQDHQKRYFARLHLDQCITGAANFMERVKVRGDDIKGFNAVYKQMKFKHHRIHKDISNNLNIPYNGDLIGHYNFGVKNGRLVVLDYGCSRTVVNMYSVARKEHGYSARGKRWNNKNFGLNLI